MTEWLLILCVVYGGGGSAQLATERFVNEADCQNALTVAKALALPRSSLSMDGTCLKVSPL